MHSEIDLELYTIIIIKLNTAFNKLETSGYDDEIKTLIGESVEDFEAFYDNIHYNLNHNRINFDEYLRFFEYGLLTFPRHIEDLKTIQNGELDGYMARLIKVFEELNKLAIAFCKTEVIK